MSKKARLAKPNSSPREAGAVAPPPPAAEGRASAALGTVPPGQEACVWMRAGVLRYRLCDSGLDCEHCLLDAALHGTREQATCVPGDWGPSGYCLFPRDRRFSRGHVWSQPAGTTSVRVGVDALAAWLVGDVERVRWPDPGSKLVRGQALATLYGRGGQVTVPCPMDGSMGAQNPLLRRCPELVSAAPYGAGWLVEVQLSEPRRRSVPALMTAEAAEALSRGQLHAFYRRVDGLVAARRPRVGATLADGGQPVTDPRALLGPALYFKLVQELFA